MQLTQFTDYSIRSLLYLGLKNDICTVQEIAQSFKISKNHLVKVIHELSQRGFIHTTRGRNGGISLKPKTRMKRIGDLIAELEPNLDLVECFDVAENTCPIIGVCGLERLLYKARAEFLNTLNTTTLGDLLATPGREHRLKNLGITHVNS